VLASIERGGPLESSADGGQEPRPVSALVTAGFALAAALLFGANLFATSRVAGDIPLAWTILPARLAGVVGVTVPLLVMGRLRLVRAAVPFVLLVGLAEVAGIATYAIGSTDSAAVAAVLASQFATIAAVAAFLLYGERLNRVQVVGVAIVVVGVSALALIQAG
jgi:drug/metabolite transporter (DMT)-like permease